jgi:ABC-2 type transport system permease protein
MILTTLVFSLLGFINGLFAKKFDDVSIVPTFILTPLTYLGGVFYSLSFLPPFWQKVSLFNPILYLVNAFRFGFLGHSDVPVAVALFILFFFVIILWFLCLGLVKKGFGLRL